MKKPDFIIIGAMKSATSSLHEQLALQPGFFMSTPKEPNFFSDDLVYQRGLTWYAHLFSSAREDDLCGESSTHYTKLPDYPHTVRRMKGVLPNIKLIYVIRNPIDRLISHYIHQWSQNEIRCDINTAIKQFPELVNYSLYHMQLSPYVKAFGAGNIKIVCSEELRTDPQRQLEQVAEFLGYTKTVKWHHDLNEQNVSSQRIRRFVGYELIIDNFAMTWIRRNLIPKTIRERIKKQLRMDVRPKIELQKLKELELTFSKDLIELGELLKLDKNFY